MYISPILDLYIARCVLRVYTLDGSPLLSLCTCLFCLGRSFLQQQTRWLPHLLQGFPSRSHLKWALPVQSPILSPCLIFLSSLETNIHYSLVLCVVRLTHMKFSFLRARSFVCCSYSYKLCSQKNGWCRRSAK